jgi:ribosomal protein S15P/S13E
MELPFQLTFPVIVLFAAALALSAYGFITGINRLNADPNEHRHTVKEILKKYSGEIVVSEKPLLLERYSPVYVSDFQDLLKLAVNLNKHIMCHHNDAGAMFAVLVDIYSYVYTVDYYVQKNHPPENEPIEEEYEDSFL